MTREIYTLSSLKTLTVLAASAAAMTVLSATPAFAAPAVSTAPKAAAPQLEKQVENRKRDRVRPDRRTGDRDRPTRRDRVYRTYDDNTRGHRSDRTRRDERRRVERRDDRRRLDRRIDRRVERRVDRHLDHRTARRNHYRPYRANLRNRHYRGHNRHYSPYRSNVGISFSFGNSGYSPYRWASSQHSFYRPGRVSFAGYTSGTRCERIIVDGFHYGTLRPISVKQCYNPWDGYYIIQGSERVVRNRW